MQTKTRKTHKTRRGPSQATQERQAEIELAIQSVDDDAPDLAAFLARWGGRYSEHNLKRLWVQAPRATVLHKFGTWRGMGRQVRKGEHAIWLVQPHTHFDPERISEANPEGKVFTGANWMALFDISQISELGEDFTEDIPDATPDTLAEIKRLRAVAVALHPDTTGRDTAAEFIAAWSAYETARNATRPATS